MTKKRYLRWWIQYVLEVLLMLSLGILCSVSIVKVNVWSMLLIMIPTAVLTVSGILLMKYGRYSDEI